MPLLEFRRTAAAQGVGLASIRTISQLGTGPAH